jgi:hypothetical protein
MTIHFIGIVYQWTALDLFYPQNLSSSIKAQEMVSSIIIIYFLAYVTLIFNCLYIMYQILKSQYTDQFIIVPLVVIFTKFDAQVIQEYVKLDNYQDKWAKARENADITFQSQYLANVLSTEYPPKAYVRLEGEENKIFHPG